MAVDSTNPDPGALAVALWIAAFVAAGARFLDGDSLAAALRGFAGDLASAVVYASVQRQRA